MKKSDFIFDKESGRISAGSEIAEAVILCKRPTSYPLANQTFLAQFQFSGEIENLPTAEGTKIFIEIKENLILDPTLIQDAEGESNYAKGFGIGEIKAAQSWPTHDNYLKLYEIQGEELVDLRKAISLPSIDEVAQKTSTLEEKMTTAEGQISQLVEAGNPKFIEINKTVSGNTTSQRSAPADGLLKIECQASAIGVSGGKIFINGEMVFGFHHANDYPNIGAILLIPAKEGIINIQTQTNNGSASVKLLLFIAFQGKKS